ncbi:protein TonB [Paraburkholderia sp. GAS333]
MPPERGHPSVGLFSPQTNCAHISRHYNTASGAKSGRTLIASRRILTTIESVTHRVFSSTMPIRTRHLRRLSSCFRVPLSLGRGTMFAVLTAATATMIAGCTVTLPQHETVNTPVAAVNSATLDQYRDAVARRIVERNPSYVLHGTPQAMLRSLVVVSFVVDRNGHVVTSSVYRTNGDDEAESTALATLRRASPLPQPPGKLLNGRGQLELFEDWLFNDDGKFQLRELASPQAQNFN